ncbi:hypothetical protein QJS04_geneDACA024846 [Acorus gramineus]|uniref:DUF7705 domain-containing protein n=1 Tax=Acorus gramineus TaxID=55184 RepID=A0AAV9A3W2_ACOGR|nr:hypothetical protein QJS04_geneDACA024846 [Acorus gramineus]
MGKRPSSKLVQWWSMVVVLAVVILFGSFTTSKGDGYVSAVGDPGMKRDGLRVALEAWNFCNEVGAEAPNMGSPRAADCFDLLPKQYLSGMPKLEVSHLVTEEDNSLGVGDPMPGAPPKYLDNVDLYAVAKEIYLGDKCQVRDTPKPWQFWMIMLKNGNMDTSASLCPKDGVKVGPFPPQSRFPCFGKGCMNQPLVYHKYTRFVGNDTLRGSFYGSYDLDAVVTRNENTNREQSYSYYSVTWDKQVGGWSFHHYLKTTNKYPWLMLYLRSDATDGFSGGYHYPTRGMTKIIPESPDFKVRVTLEVKQGGGPNSQFYLMDMGGCWKNDGRPCDGDVTTDVTRYSEMIINPETQANCQPNRIDQCPPYHTFANGTRVHRNDTANFPYDAYHLHCVPGNAQHFEEPYNICDQYSNPQPQEIMQIVPHPVWGEYGYPTAKGEGWIGDKRTWELDVGGMSQNLYFYQDPGTPPVKRQWSSLDVGTEIYVSKNQVAEWTVSDFDIFVPNTEQKSLA